MEELEFPQNFWDRLADALKANYRVRRDVRLAGHKIPLLAELNWQMEHYAVSRKIVLERNESRDFLAFLGLAEDPVESYVQAQVRWLNRWAGSTSGRSGHMRTRYIGIFFLHKSRFNDQLLRRIRKSARTRSLKFGFHGWIEQFLVAITLPEFNPFGPYRARDLFPLLRSLKPIFHEG